MRSFFLALFLLFILHACDADVEGPCEGTVYKFSNNLDGSFFAFANWTNHQLKITDVTITVSFADTENKRKPDGTLILNNNLARNITLFNDVDKDSYTFVKFIELIRSDRIKFDHKTLYYRNDEPSRKNFDKSKPCDIVEDKVQDMVTAGNICNWESNLLEQYELPGDYVVFAQVFYAPKECNAFSCHMNMKNKYHCGISYPVSIDNY
ncbi:10060_t:CDS:1 [Funneliformis caledonium]|uniref:10060_t:CDS:1 n=1 Tax=Funneliformis caledonium TaxID=1117310 RepID=A0A9N8Z2D5_9GLOM|nr:10060_t:CDS:1 [Funneliformis caledonium]